MSVDHLNVTSNGSLWWPVNYFTLHWDRARWWISGTVWDAERPTNPLPDEWVGRQERSP